MMIPKPKSAWSQRCPLCTRNFRSYASFVRHVAQCSRKRNANRLGNTAKKTQAGEFLFDSGLERKLYDLLKLRELAGEIRELKVKPNVLITDASILVIPDFSAIDVKTEALRFHEAKGFKTEIWKLKMRLWRAYGPAPIDVYIAGRRGPLLSETIETRVNGGKQ